MKFFLSCFSLLLSFSIVPSASAAFPAALSNAYNHTLELSKQAKTTHSSANFRFTIDAGTEGGANGTLNIFEQRDTSDLLNIKLKDQFIFDISLTENELSGKLNGSLTFILANHTFYIRLDRLSINSSDFPELQYFIDSQNLTGRWFMLPIDDSLFVSNMDQFQNINDPKQNFADATGLTTDEIDQISNSFLNNNVLVATKDDELYKGLTTYDLRLNKRGTILFFRDVGSILLKEANTHFSITELFELKKALIRSKNMRFKVLVDEEKSMIKGYVIYFASQFKDAIDTKVDLNIVGEIMLDGINQAVNINAPTSAESLESFLENDFLNEPDMLNFADPDELERFLEAMSDTICYLREYTAEKRDIRLPFVTQEDVEALTADFNPNNDPTLRENMDRIAQNHGFLDYDDFDVISLKYPPSDELKDQVEAMVLDQCNFDFSFGFLDGKFVVLQ